MDEQTLLIARFGLWLLTACTVVLPMRWAFVCFLCAAQFNIVTGSLVGTESIEIDNAIRILVLPLILLIRTRFEPLRGLRWTRAHQIWLALAVYAACATVWSPYPLSAMKMVCYLFYYLVLFSLLVYAWRNKYLSMKLISALLWISLLLGAIQTYVLPDSYGRVTGPFDSRFTSFIDAQSYATFLVAIVAILLFADIRGLARKATIAVATAGILLTGSRYVSLGVLFLFAIKGLAASDAEGRVHVRVRPRMLLLGSVALCLVGYLIASEFPDNRLAQLVDVAVEPRYSLEDIGTVASRLALYQVAFERLASRNSFGLLFGSGTSSAGEVRFEVDPGFDDADLDPNRTLHDEFLRSLYEWGFIGLSLLAAFLLVVTVGFLRQARKPGGRSALGFIGVLPTIFAALAMENFLTYPSGAGGVGVLLAMSYGIAPELIAQV